MKSIYNNDRLPTSNYGYQKRPRVEFNIRKSRILTFIVLIIIGIFCWFLLNRHKEKKVVKIMIVKESPVASTVQTNTLKVEKITDTQIATTITGSMMGNPTEKPIESIKVDVSKHNEAIKEPSDVVISPIDDELTIKKTSEFYIHTPKPESDMFLMMVTSLLIPILENVKRATIETILPVLDSSFGSEILGNIKDILTKQHNGEMTIINGIMQLYALLIVGVSDAFWKLGMKSMAIPLLEYGHQILKFTQTLLTITHFENLSLSLANLVSPLLIYIMGMNSGVYGPMLSNMLEKFFNEIAPSSEALSNFKVSDTSTYLYLMPSILQLRNSIITLGTGLLSLRAGLSFFAR